MLYEEEYIQQISHRLDQFHEVTREPTPLYNFRCPFCGDSQKSKTKMRGYFYQNDRGRYKYHCHNCGVQYGLPEFLEQFDDSIYRQYLFDRFRDRDERKKEDDEVKVIATATVDESIFDGIFERIETLPRSHPCFAYVRSRKIPRNQWDRLFFCEDMRACVKLFPRYKDRLKTHESRLVLPVRDEAQKLIGLIGRAYDPAVSLRYLTLRANEDTKLSYGLDRIRYDRPILVVEGPIDSLFLPNCVAAAGSALQRLQSLLPIETTTYVWDNQPRNKDVVKAVTTAARQGFRVCVWPSTPGKDVNEMILNGWSSSRVLDVIKSSTYQGLEAELKVEQWRKIEPRKSGL